VGIVLSIMADKIQIIETRDEFREKEARSNCTSYGVHCSKKIQTFTFSKKITHLNA